MIRMNLCLLTALIAITTFSCKKGNDKTLPVTPIDSPVIVTYDDYMALKPGNYWIYQDYKLDSANGAAHALGTYDSSYVEKDTTINGLKYHKYLDANYAFGSPSTYSTYFLRDSASYTVDQTGLVKFSSRDFTSIFRTIILPPNSSSSDTIIITEQMGFRDVITVVDAGSFTTSTLRRIYHFPATYQFGPTRDYDFKYAKNIGLVSGTTAFFTGGPSVYEKRLVRYHVQ